MFNPGLVLFLVFVSQSHANGSRIVGGSDVAPESPMARGTVALIIDQNALCTGSLIAQDMIVTAAHCLNGAQNIQIVFSTQVDSESLSQAIPATRFAIHPQYDPANTGIDENDVAVLNFTGGLPQGFKPDLVLADDSLLEAGATAVLAGYGITDAASQAGAGRLRETTVSLLDPDLGNSEALIDQSQGQGACHGDSGGPAFIKKGNTLYLWGITSRSYPNSAPDDCSHQAVYTKIPDELSFIQTAVRMLRE